MSRSANLPDKNLLAARHLIRLTCCASLLLICLSGCDDKQQAARQSAPVTSPVQAAEPAVKSVPLMMDNGNQATNAAPPSTPPDVGSGPAAAPDAQQALPSAQPDNAAPVQASPSQTPYDQHGDQLQKPPATANQPGPAVPDDPNNAQDQ